MLGRVQLQEKYSTTRITGKHFHEESTAKSACDMDFAVDSPHISVLKSVVKNP